MPVKPKKINLRGKVARIRKPSIRNNFTSDDVRVLMADGKEAFHTNSISQAAREMLREKFGYVQVKGLLIEPNKGGQMRERLSTKRKALPAPKIRLKPAVIRMAQDAAKDFQLINQRVRKQKLSLKDEKKSKEPKLRDILVQAKLLDAEQKEVLYPKDLTHIEFDLEGKKAVSPDQEKVLRILGFTQRGYPGAKGKDKLRLRNVLW